MSASSMESSNLSAVGSQASRARLASSTIATLDSEIISSFGSTILSPSSTAIPDYAPTSCPIHCSPCECLAAVDDAWAAQRIDLHRAIGTELVQSTRSFWDESIALHEVVEQLVDVADEDDTTTPVRPWSSLSSDRASPWPPWPTSTSLPPRATLSQLSDFQREQWDQKLARIRNALTTNPSSSVDVLLRVGRLAPSIALIALAAPRAPTRLLDDAVQAEARTGCPWLCFAESFLGAAEPQQDQSTPPRPGTAHRASITALRESLRMEKDRLQLFVNLLRDLLERHADDPRSGVMHRGSATPEALAVAVELMCALQPGHRIDQADERGMGEGAHYRAYDTILTVIRHSFFAVRSSATTIHGLGAKHDPTTGFIVAHPVTSRQHAPHPAI
ncbi:hypothetical protein AMAG_20211 [Allomyces macrogynus ATCC 38327]|uniref:Uncharacterized protein n=1 Tax=Allomyces macrogynus (strain ATCC 38327) TaxID=578462 RepID=A0A0L0T836_ALLM3|nr:hypothetical protein AMAG_20211 [Allomyces macrogynus ATCC 38327]|eukprot:KNE70917.1 hypothetical protein AMAG_20211 [Allomyces macrogynus ATCC 38327]